MCLCYAVDDGPVVTLTRQTLAAGIIELDKLSGEGAEFHAHNAYFERSIWLNKLVPKYLADPIPIKQWRCTAAKCMAHALPRSLENAAAALDCKHKKDMGGNTVMRFIAASKGPIEQVKLDRLYKYCAQDVEVEREIDQRLPDLCPREQKVWFLDQYINDTGVCIDVDAVQKASACITEEVDELTKKLQTLSGGEINAGTQRDAIKNYLEKKGCKLPDLTKKTVTSALEKAGGDNFRILQLRQQLSLTSNAKYQALLDTVSTDGRVRDILVYHGASTGRWTGKLVQLQNLPKPTEADFNNVAPIRILKESPESFKTLYAGSILQTLSASIRGMLIPTPGYEMFITDFAAIEARVVMWLAEEEMGLEIFRRQDSDPAIPDIYVHMARVIYNKAYLTKKNKLERQLGKQATLACGFGMGATKFQATCATYNIEVDENLATRAVQAYRSTFKKVVRFWYAMEEAAIRAVNTGKPVQIGKILWRMEGEFLRMRLPAGRDLVYHRPRVSAENRLSFMAANPVTKRYVPEDTWGGTLVENAVQGTARDIMVDSMLNMASNGFRILFTVHDELVVEALKGAKTPEDILKTVKNVPSWAAGCPINAECEKVERYKK
jgi:DNA polymerase